MRAPRTGPKGSGASRSRGFFVCGLHNEKRLPQGDRRGGAPRRRRDRHPAHLARRLPRAGALAAQSLRPGVGARSPRGLPRRRRPDPDDEHLGRQPREADVARVGRLAREDQPRGRAPRPRGRRRRAACSSPDRSVPLGALVKPYGSLQLSQVREIFEEQARLLLESGVDLILLETFGSLLEAAEAVRAVRGALGRDPARRRDDVSRGRTDGLRRGRAARPRDPRARRRRRGRHELHARARRKPTTSSCGCEPPFPRPCR